MPRTILTAVAAVLSAQAAQADPMIGDPAAGFAFAMDNCAECHLVEPEWTGSFGSPAKAFPEIAANPKTTELSLKVFLRTPHLAMPNFILSEPDTENVVAYILSLKPAREDERE